METNTVSFLDDKVDFLSEVEVFSDTDTEVLEKIATVLVEKRFTRQEPIVKKGQTGDTMYIITRGEVRVHDRGHVLCRLGPGEVFGEYSLFDEETRSASVTAEKVTYVLELRGDDFARVCDRHPEVPRGVLMRLIKKMRERNILEEKLAKSYIRIQKQKTEIEDQNESIQKQKRLLEQQNFDLLTLNEEKNKLIEIVVHGLKNPITSSKCLTEMILDDSELKSEHREGLEVVLNSIKRVNQMINQILNIDAIESKVYQPKIEIIELQDYTKQIWKDYQHQFEFNEIETELELENVSACLNKVYFCQIIDNLISNSIERINKKGKLILRIFKMKDQVHIMLEDNGPDLNEKQTNKIFNQYKRQQSKMINEGDEFGLSLAIVHKYATAMQGHIQIKSTPGSTQFEIIFPAECK